MKFSIITITYNAEKFLSETLASTAQQEFSDFEHVIWDGGSTDKTLSIASAYSHVKVYQGKDLGISDAMNRGAKVAQGDFLLHLHADDCLAHRRVLLQVAHCLKQHPGVSWLYGQVGLMDEKGEAKGMIPFVSYREKLLQKYNMISHPGVLVSRKLFFEAGGFDPSLKFCMDYDLWIRLAQKISPFPLKTPVAFFRSHEGSLSTANPQEVAREAYLVRNRYISSCFRKWKSYRTYKKRIKAFS